jgi:hypothetical protein
MPSSAEASFEQKFAVNGPVSLDISIKSGYVRVQRGEEGSVTVRGELKVFPSIFSWRDPEERLRRLGEFPVSQNGNVITVGDMLDPWTLHRIDFLLEITAPPETRVRALVDSADVRIDGIQGPVECEADSGEIEVSNISSGVIATADSGSISIRRVAGVVEAEVDSGSIEALEIGGPIDAKADSGSIELSQTAAAPIYARADSGDVSIKLAPAAGYNVSIHTDGGRVEVPELSRATSDRHEIDGAIRGGGPIVQIETDSGSIEVL